MRNANAIKAIYSVLIAFMTMFCLSTSFVDDASAKPKQENAQDKEYNKLVKAGAAAYNDGDYENALLNFNGAYAIKPEASLLYNIGRVCEDYANYPCAIENYQKFLMSPGSDPDAREDAKDRIRSCQETLQLAGGSIPAPVAVAPVGFAAPAAAPVAAAHVGNCVDVNKAGLAELTSLNGVGKVTAQNIIDYRNANGGIKSLNDLLNVKKIGDKTLAKFGPQVCPIGVATAPAAQPAAAPAAQPTVKPADNPVKGNAPKAVANKAPQKSPKKAANNAIDI